METGWSAELCWRLFEATGSIWAYLGYRQRWRDSLMKWVSLN